MPRILPVDEEVSWPSNEGAIGIVGVAPWATIDFLKALYAQVSASKDWHYPRVLCDINTKLPSRGRHLELGERDPSPFIAATIAELAEQGATLAVVPCNTAHILYSRWASGSPIPVPNIVTATIDVLGTGGAKKAAVFVSPSLHRHGIYQQAILSAGIDAVSLDEEGVELISLAIHEVKTSARISLPSLTRIENLLEQLAARGVDGLVLGCTELTGLELVARRFLPVVAESNNALAAAALRGISMTPVASSDRNI